MSDHPTTPGDAEPRERLAELIVKGWGFSALNDDAHFRAKQNVAALLASPDLPTVCGSSWTAEQLEACLKAAEKAGTVERLYGHGDPPMTHGTQMWKVVRDA